MIPFSVIHPKSNKQMEQLNALTPSSIFSQAFSPCPDTHTFTVSTKRLSLSTAVLSPSAHQPKEVSTAPRCKGQGPKAHEPVICWEIRNSGNNLEIRICVDWVFCLAGNKELHTTLSTPLYITGTWSKCLYLATR